MSALELSESTALHVKRVLCEERRRKEAELTKLYDSGAERTSIECDTIVGELFTLDHVINQLRKVINNS